LKASTLIIIHIFTLYFYTFSETQPIAFHNSDCDYIFCFNFPQISISSVSIYIYLSYFISVISASLVKFHWRAT